MQHVAVVTPDALLATSGDRTIKAVMFWLVIALVVAGTILAVRRARGRRTMRGAPDDWHPPTGRTGQEGPRPWQ